MKLPWGFSPWQAAQQIADDLNPFDGGSRDRDIFSDKYNQRNGQRVNVPGNVIEVTTNTSGNTGQAPQDGTWYNGGGYYGGYGGGYTARPAVDQNAINSVTSQRDRTQSAIDRLGGSQNTAMSNLLNQFNNQNARMQVQFDQNQGDYTRNVDKNRYKIHLYSVYNNINFIQITPYCCQFNINNVFKKYCF